MPNSQQLYLENRYLQLSPNYPHDQPKNWVKAFVAKMMDEVDIVVADDPQHFSSTTLYQNFVKLCTALHPRRAKLSHMASLFKQLYQVDLDFKLDMGAFREKILPNQHRLQYSWVYHPTTHALSKYEVSSFYIFHNKLVVLQLLCNKSQTDFANGKSVVSWQIDYLLELYQMSADIKGRFQNKRELFNIENIDSSNRLHCVQLLSIIYNDVHGIEILGVTSGEDGMTIEHLNYRDSRYFVSVLPIHKYLLDLNRSDLEYSQQTSLWRNGRHQLCVFEQNYVMSVDYIYQEKVLFFKLYDEKVSFLHGYQRHKLTVRVELGLLSSKVEILTIEMGKMSEEEAFHEGLYIRISQKTTQPVILINVLKPGIANSITYELKNRASLANTVQIDEDVYQKLSSLLVQSRLDVLLRTLMPQIKWEDYGFVHQFEAIYCTVDASHKMYSFSERETFSKNAVSIADLDQYLELDEFCPRLSQRFTDLVVNNVKQCGLLKNDLIQTLAPAEEAARIECIEAYVQEFQSLMAVQRNEFMRLENNRRNKFEHESYMGFKQINKKYQESYLLIILQIFLSARYERELELWSEFQQLLLPFMRVHQLIIGEQLARRHVERVISQDSCSLINFKSGFFGALNSKRETVMQCMSERKTLMDDAKNALKKLQCAHEQRRALQTREEESRAHLANCSLRILDSLSRYNDTSFAGSYSQAQLFELGYRTLRTADKYIDILRAPCAGNRNGQSILETLFFAEDQGWDVFMGGSASRGSPWANDLDIKLSPANKEVTEEQRFKLFLIFEALLEHASNVRGYPEKGLMTFDIHGHRIPVNIVIYLTYKGQYYNDPLYTDDVVVRIKREKKAIGATWLQFYRHHYHPDNPEQSVDKEIDLISVGQILQTQHIHASRYDPAAILRVLREMAYSPKKEGVNSAPLKALIAKMQADVPNSLYQETLHDFYEGKHRVAPEYFDVFLRLLKRYGLPERSNQALVKPQLDGRVVGHFLTKATRYGYAHLIELLVDQHKRQSVDTRPLSVLECIEKVLKRQNRNENFIMLRDFAVQCQGTTSVQPTDSTCTKSIKLF